MSDISPLNRTWSLAFGVAYILGGVLAGLNLDLVWASFAPPGVQGQAHHAVSVLTTFFPHVWAIAGFALLIAGSRIAKVWFALIALVPFIYTAGCLFLRSQI